MKNLSDRIKILKSNNNNFGNIFYLMRRELRVNNNWSLIYSQKLAIGNNSKLIAGYWIDPKKENYNDYQAKFLLQGLNELNDSLLKNNIGLKIFSSKFITEIKKIINDFDICTIVTDFFPIKQMDQQIESLNKLNINIHIVDSHNIVPVWQASDKQEWAAYTIRPKIKKQLDKYLTDFPKLKKLAKENLIQFDNSKVLNILNSNFASDFAGGETGGQQILNKFIKEKLPKYDELRNNPVFDFTSNLSPYLHFGYISSQQIAFEIKKIEQNSNCKSFLEELIVRKELSDNYCFYNNKYDLFEGFPEWAKTTLEEHRNDKREYTYNLTQFEKAKTHDPLWNAAQNQLLNTARMHGYLRMYWAKKIIEWSEAPEDALNIAIYLNDKYALDGIDPNGYTGIAWSIGGVHDRAWTERPVFGKVRYMNYNGCKRKFDVKKYILMNGGENE